MGPNAMPCPPPKNICNPPLKGIDSTQFKIDYFEFQLTIGSHADYLVENLVSRGLLFGKEYELGSSCRRIWGLYGSYDFMWLLRHPGGE